MSKEGSITPRTLRLTSPLFSSKYLDKQRQALKAEKSKLSAVSTQQSALISNCEEKINKFFKLKPQDNKSEPKNNKSKSKALKETKDNKQKPQAPERPIIFEKIIEPKQIEIQQKIKDKEVALKLLENSNAFNSDPWLMKFYQPSIIPDEPLMELGKNLIPNPSIPLIPYFSINDKNPVLENQPLNTTELHSLEKYVFKEAIKYLENQCAADEYFRIREGELSVSPNNVALVNFFPRSNNVIKVETTKETTNSQVIEAAEPLLETHTIVLWKVSENEIKVIDPSNSGFSSFLKDISVNNKFKFLVDEGKKSILKNIYQADNELPITKRDCTDIAVKIGFELNQRQTDCEVTTVQDCLQQSIEQISNTTPSFAGGLKLFKALQSSDLEVRKKAAELKETIHNLKVTDKSFLTELDLTKFDSWVEPKTIIEDIQELIELLGDLNNGGIL